MNHSIQPQHPPGPANLQTMNRLKPKLRAYPPLQQCVTHWLARGPTTTAGSSFQCFAEMSVASLSAVALALRNSTDVTSFSNHASDQSLTCPLRVPSSTHFPLGCWLFHLKSASLSSRHNGRRYRQQWRDTGQNQDQVIT